MSAWLSAHFVHPPDEPIQIRMRPDGDELLIQNASAGQVVARWTFASLYKSDESTSETYMLRSSAHEAAVQITDLAALHSLDWLWRLPAQKAKDPRKLIATTIGGASAVVIGLIICLYFALMHPPAKLETSLFRDRPVFPESALCQSEVGRDALVTLLKPLLELRNGKEPLRISVYKNEALESFAFPAGRIFISSGLLAKLESPAEFAGLIAHQMEHVARAHPLAALTRDGVITPYLRLLRENRADTGLDPSLIQLFVRPQISAAEEKLVHQAAVAQLERADLPSNGLAMLFTRLRERGEFPSFYTDHKMDELTPIPQAPGKVDVLDSDWLALKKICD